MISDEKKHFLFGAVTAAVQQEFSCTAAYPLKSGQMQDKVDFLRHLCDLTEDHGLGLQIGIRYSWANGALNLLISLDPSPDHDGLLCFLSSQRAMQLTPSVHAYYSINDKYSSLGFRTV